jgi:glyoxylase-like metal-dependent hydrolase (beta-lactamase superfamily II)
MLKVKKFIFNPFQLNAYIVYNEKGDCLLFDPAVSSSGEMQQLEDFISENNLTPKLLVNTHSHIDHIIGNQKVTDRYGLQLAAHPAGQPFLDRAYDSAARFGLALDGVKEIDISLDEGDTLALGDDVLQVFYTPGHADGSLCFYAEPEGFVITGDVLFYQSIGRTDLPTGDYDLLQKSIWQKLFVLPDETRVYPGHGPDTKIGQEKVNNPFVAIGIE